MTGDPGPGSPGGLAGAIVVMGVSAVGKSAVGRALAARLGAVFIDADDLHSRENVAKMSAGTPLEDADRWPWLDAVARAATAAAGTAVGAPVVVACSALRRRYRDRLRGGMPGTLFVHLVASRERLEERAGARPGHFMPAALLDSQLAALEPLEGDEAGFAVEAEGGVPLTVERIVEQLPAA